MLRARLDHLHNALMQGLSGLPTQLQIALRIGVAGIGIALLYLLLLLPTQTYLQTAQARETRERDLLAWIRQHEAQARALQPAPAPTDDPAESLLALASASGKQAGLNFQRFEPGKRGQLTLWLSDVEFNVVLNWLDQLTTHERIRINRIALSQSSRAGAVEAQIVLSR